MAAITALPPALSSPVSAHSAMDTLSRATLVDIATGAAPSQREDAGQNFLTTKMLSVLRNLQYDDEALQRVASRISANLWSQGMPPPESEGSVSDVLRQKLKAGFDRSLINSNEPVLLFSVPHQDFTTSSSTLIHLKSTAVAQLREQGIKPVRVYTRIAGDSIAVLLLNVVNTDIGGPSMVQLLDAAFHGSDWTRDLVSKEAYHEYELLWHDEQWPFNGTKQQEVSGEVPNATTAHTETEDGSDRIVQGPTVPLQCQTSVQMMEAGIDSAVSQDCREMEKIEADDEEVDSHEPEKRIEHPEWTAWQERDAARAPIQHPTWSREHEDTSFLDLITGQSANVVDGDPMSIISGHGAQHGTNAPRSENSADDDFVLLGDRTSSGVE